MEGHPVCTSEALRARKIGEGPCRSPQGILDAAGDSPPLRRSGSMWCRQAAGYSELRTDSALAFFSAKASS